MAKVFVFESVTASRNRFAIAKTSPAQTELISPLAPWAFVPSGSLLEEGTAMVCAAVLDLLSIAGVEVEILWDERLSVPDLLSTHLSSSRLKLHSVESTEDFDVRFETALNECDRVLLIAPEIEQELEYWTSFVNQRRADLPLHGLTFVGWASDKWKTFLECVRRGSATPRTWLQLEQFKYDLAQQKNSRTRWDDNFLIKPRTGAGSIGIRPATSEALLLTESRDGQSANDKSVDQLDLGNSIIQERVVGRSVSILCLVTPANIICFPPSKQVVDPHSFEYLGSDIPVDNDDAARASVAVRNLLENTIASGFVGVDLILEDLSDGGRDYVVDVNPRLTTSYLAVRKAIDVNPMQLWLHGECNEKSGSGLDLSAGRSISFRLSQ